MPSPLKKSFAAEQLRQRQKKSPATIIILVVAVIIAVIAVGYALYMRFGKKEIPTETIAPSVEEIKSIAVLPFENLSADPEQDYFCDGMADAIINALTHVEDLNVTARTSAFAFKGKEVSISDIGRQLGVETVLEGSVLKSGNRLRITAQLVNVDDGFHLWSKKFDSEMEDMFAIHDEISLSIVEALKVKLLKGEKAAIEKRYTEDIDAYDLYLLGRSHWIKRTTEGRLKALEYFEKAIENDPNFALAYTGKADTYFYHGTVDSLSIKESWQRGKNAAQTALHLDDNLAGAHSSFARYALYLDWDWETAIQHFNRALKLNPNYALAHWHYHDYLWVMGRADEAISEMKRAQELDPLSVILYAITVSDYSFLGRYDEAMEQYQKAFEIDPNNRETLSRLCWHHYYLQENYTKAIDTWIKWLKLGGFSKEQIETNGWLGRLYARAGERDKAERILKALKEQTPVPLFPMFYIYAGLGENDKAVQILNEIIERKKEGENIRSIWIALLYLELGNNDKTFEWLNNSIEYRDGGIDDEIIIKLQPEWAHLRSDPRFKALLKKMGLPEE